MKTKIARQISPAAIAIALFLAVALLTRGAPITVTNTNDSRVDYYKNHQQNPFSETSVSSIAAVYSLDAVWYQMLTGASCDRLRNFAYSTASSG